MKAEIERAREQCRTWSRRFAPASATLSLRWAARRVDDEVSTGLCELSLRRAVPARRKDGWAGGVGRCGVIAAGP